MALLVLLIYLHFLKLQGISYETANSSDVLKKYRVIIPLVKDTEFSNILKINQYLISLGLKLDTCVNRESQYMFFPINFIDYTCNLTLVEGQTFDAEKFIINNNIDKSLASRDEEKVSSLAKTIADPTKRRDPIGEFCRKFSIYDVLNDLRDVYTEVEKDLYLYNKSSTDKPGLRIYDGLFAFSFHSSDPGSNRLMNAFDLISVHRYNGSNSKAIEALKEQGSLKTTPKRISSIEDAMYLLQNKGIGTLVKQDEFSGYTYVDIINLNKLYQAKLSGIADEEELNSEFERISDTIMTKIYFIAGVNQRDFTYIKHSISLLSQMNSYNSVTDKVKSIVWDHKPRVDDFMHEYMGSPDNEIYRRIFKIFLHGAMMRAFKPGSKMDTMLVLQGPQGSYKSTLIKKLSLGFFSESLPALNNPNITYVLRNNWMVEIAELDAFKKADIEAIKHFLSIECDEFRPVWGTHAEKFLRHVAFIGNY